MKRLLLLAVVLTLGLALLPPATPSTAQSNPVVEERIDLVMDHLTQWLGFQQPITRNSHLWRWSQNVYNDTSLGCPAPNQTYTQVTQRGYRIFISVDGIDWDYRVAEDGSYFILCGMDGLPLFDSNNPVAPLPPAATAPATQGISLPPYAWYAWGYSPVNDEMYLITPLGLLTSIPRPSSGQAIIETSQMTISPDGRRMVAREVLNAGEQVIFYDFQTGEVYATYGLQPGETVSFGFTSRSSFIGKNPNQFSPDGSRFALGIRGPNYGEWRLVIFDTALGTVIGQIGYLDWVALLAGADLSQSPLLQDAVTAAGQGGGFFPSVIYHASDGTVHFQLVPDATGGGAFYPAMAWNPSNPSVGFASPYTYSQIDVLTADGRALYAGVNAFMPTRPAEGPYPSLNQITLGTPNGATFVPADLYGNTDRYLFSPQFASTDGSIIVFNPALPTDFGIVGMYRSSTAPGGPSYEELPTSVESVIGVTGGAVAVQQVESFPSVVIFAAPGNIRDTLFEQANVTDLELVWATPPGVQMGLNTVDTTPSLAPNLGGGPVVVNPPVVSGQPISYGASVRGVVNNATPVQEYTFNGLAGDAVVISMFADDVAFLDPVLRLFDANGNLIAENDDFDNLNSRISTILPTNGTYRIEAARFSGAGDFTLTLSTQGTAGNPSNAGTVVCPGTIPSRLSVGIRARVTFTDGTPLRLRATPSGTFIRDLQEGTAFTVIGGPTCDSNFTWWNIQLDNGTSGWSAEGDLDTYFIEPLN